MPFNHLADIELVVQFLIRLRTEEEHMSETIDAVRKLITERLSELEAEATRLEQALKSMGERDGSRLTAPKSQRKRATPKRRRHRAQAPPPKRREQLLAAIRAKPGARPSELTADIGILRPKSRA